jgi:hypothetical protein
MRLRKFVRMAAIALLGSALASSAASAGGAVYGYRGGGHGYAYPRASVGVYVGPGWYGPRPYWGGAYWGAWPYAYGAFAYPYYYAPYYYPPAVVAPSAPQVYIERDPQPVAPAQQQPSQWWYFCTGANGYYPYVKECPGGWQRVAPQPPPPS